MKTLTKTWKIAQMDRVRVRALAEAAAVPHIIAHLLLLRGVEAKEAAEDFLVPRLKHLSDPFLLTDMQAAVDRIALAKARQERVLVFGDYDVDGISATCIMVHGLKRYGLEHVRFGMPQRSTGYGLGVAHVEDAARDGVQLIVTVDNGIAAHDAVARAAELGIDVVVTDHHAIEQGLPSACAVVNPKRDHADHPAYHLCGAGVAFKVSTALNGTPNDLDLAALGTVADVMPLLGENRVIVALGLRHMAKHKRTGLERLAAAAGLKMDELNTEKIGFQLSPRLNAAGRLDDGGPALNLLLADCPQLATQLAQELNEANQTRRELERDIFDAIVEEIEACGLIDGRRSIVLARRGWHMGVVGIVAARLQMRYNRPTLLISLDENGLGRGSARAPQGFNLIEAFTSCQQFFVKYGGHKAAAGCTIQEEAVAALADAFEEEARKQLGDGEAVPELRVDALAALGEIDGQLIRELERLEPFGNSNPAPILCSMGVEVLPQSIRVMKDTHLAFTVRQGERRFNVIGFGMAERFYTDPVPSLADIAYTPQLSTWRGETTVQLVLKDLRPAEELG